MKELPTQLHNAMIDGLTMLLTLRLAATTGNVSNRARAIDLPAPMLEM